MAIAKIILNNETLMDVTQLTVDSANLLYNITALKNDGTSVTGTIATKTNSDITLTNNILTIPAGYYAAGTKTIPGVEITAPSSGTNTFYITLPNGQGDTITLLFTVDSEGNTDITEAT